MSDMRRLTMGTHTVLTEILFYSRVVASNRDYAAYLFKAGADMNPQIPLWRRSSLSPLLCELQEKTEYMKISSNIMQGFCSNLKDRVLS